MTAMSCVISFRKIGWKEACKNALVITTRALINLNYFFSFLKNLNQCNLFFYNLLPLLLYKLKPNRYYCCKSAMLLMSCFDVAKLLRLCHLYGIIIKNVRVTNHYSPFSFYFLHLQIVIIRLFQEEINVVNNKYKKERLDN